VSNWLDPLLGRLLGTSLPDPLPESPISLFQAWFDEGRREAPSGEPEAFVLATASSQARPSARVLLCKGIEPQTGAIRFFTNYTSRKAEELSTNPMAAAVFYWPQAGRQARLEGRVERLEPHLSDEYFESRPRLSRLGAWASQQSRPLDSRAALVGRVVAAAARYGVAGPIPRPEHWGGYRLIPDRVELWASNDGRLHDRAEWTRATVDTPWTARRLQP
jgi:pyridoxamine 5'-phosphate oxidase